MALLNFINKYFAAPFNSVYEYNLVNTVTYGVMAFLGIYLFNYFIIQKKVEVDNKFVLNLIPYILLGSLIRSYVDKGIINKVFFTVSPGLYLTVSSLFLIGILFGKLKEIGIVSLIAFFIVYGLNFSINSYFIFILILMIISTKIIFRLTQHLKFSNISKYALISQLFDAINTSFILLFFGGFEKHVIPRTIIEIFGTPLAFIPAKLMVIIPIIYYLNKEKNNLSKLILIAIFVLGLAQGLRNLITVL